MDTTLKSKAISSVIWKFMERIIAQLVTLVVSIIIARILSPDDYSVVSIVAIFFTFANVIISGGLNTALIQKKDADKKDYSVVLIFSVAMSALLYVILYFAAPAISDLYGKPLLIPIIRIMSLSLPIYAVKSVLCAYVSANLQFKKFFFSTIIGTLISAVFGIWMAYAGFGAWALVAQQMINTFIDTLILFVTTRIKFVFCVSTQRFESLFRYGWKVFISSMINAAYAEAVSLVIGVKYTPEDLSFYSKGKSFPYLLSTTTTSTLSAVLFPVLARYQDDKEALLRYTRRFMRVSSFIAFPMMFGFFAVSDTFISVVLTDKWLPASPYIKIFCIACMFEMIHIGNCETIKAMGRSDVYLIMEIIKKSGYFITIGMFLAFTDSPQKLALSFIGCTVIAIVVNSVPNIKLIGYSVKQQVADLLPNLINSAVLCGAVMLIGKIPLGSTLVTLLLQILTGVAVYLALSIITRNDSLTYCISFLKKLLHKKKAS